ncbi:MAG: GNAT family N-acetyltransferase, partial [Limisphaerales bacterium]
MSAEQTTIHEITFDNLANHERRQQIYEADFDFYWTSDWSPEFYIELATAGFISVAHDFGGMQLLLPQIQSAYAVLDWENLHVSRSTRRW